jgi:hypothetical protein
VFVWTHSLFLGPNRSQRVPRCDRVSVTGVGAALATAGWMARRGRGVIWRMGGRA